MIKVSIIVPAYNCEKYLEDCLNSAVNQTLKETEIIVVDDGSTDSTHQICEAYAQRYSNVKLVTLKENMGAAVSRNKGLEKAGGEYIVFLDSDDSIDFSMCEILYERAMKHKPDVLMYNVEDNISGFGERFFKDGLYNKDAITEIVFPKLIAYIDDNGWIAVTRWCVWLRMFKRELLLTYGIKFDPRFRRCQDLYFTVKTMLSAEKFEYFGEGYLYHQTIHNDSLSRGYNQGLFDLLKLLILELQDISDGFSGYDFADQVTIRALAFFGMCFSNERKAEHKSVEEKKEEILKILQHPITQKYVDKAKHLKLIRYKELIDSMERQDAEHILEDSINYGYKHLRLAKIFNKIFGYQI